LVDQTRSNPILFRSKTYYEVLNSASFSISNKFKDNWLDVFAVNSSQFYGFRTEHIQIINVLYQTNSTVNVASLHILVLLSGKPSAFCDLMTLASNWH